MGVLDFFKRTGKAITIENLEAKIGEMNRTISARKPRSRICALDLTGQVLDGDRLGAHRIEHEEREIETHSR